MKPRSGNVAMRHAKAILEDGYLVCQYAGKQIVRLPGGRMFSRSEDLLNGCFDALAVGFDVLAVQVTSQTDSRSSVSNRKRKIEREFLDEFPRMIPPPLRIEIWAWVNRRGFRVWRWYHEGAEWREDAQMLLSPLLKNRGGGPPDTPPEPTPSDR